VDNKRDLCPPISDSRSHRHVIDESITPGNRKADYRATSCLLPLLPTLIPRLGHMFTDRKMVGGGHEWVFMTDALACDCVDALNFFVLIAT
jgi:hypothetical protein